MQIYTSQPKGEVDNTMQDINYTKRFRNRHLWVILHSLSSSLSFPTQIKYLYFITTYLFFSFPTSTQTHESMNL